MYSLYTINEGDTLDSISKRVGVSPKVIANINNLEPLYIPQPGDKLVIPVQNNSIYERYEVKKGDNLYKISQIYDTSVDTLTKINGLSNAEYIYPGDIILVPRRGIKMYVTEENDTFGSISQKIKIPVAQLVSQNPNIKLLSDQIIMYY